MSSTYLCPVYKYPKRADRYIIFKVPLNCEGKSPNYWKLRGTALLCSTEWENSHNIFKYFVKS